MVWLPHGRDYLGHNFTNLKGSPGHALSANDTTFNQNAAAYLRLTPALPTAGTDDGRSGGGLSAGAISGEPTGRRALHALCNAVHPCCSELF